VAKLFVQAQATSNRSEYVFVQDSASTTGGGKTGIAYNAASFTAYYVRPPVAGVGGTAVSITLATQTVSGAYSSGGWVEVDATNLPGIYRFDIPNAVFATGVDHAVVMLKGASGMAPVSLEYQLTGFNPATSWLTAAQTANAVWDASISGYTTIENFGGLLATQAFLTYDIDDAVRRMPQEVWDEPLSSHTTAGTMGQRLNANVLADELLAREIGSGSSAGAINERTVRSALRGLRNKTSVINNEMTVYKEDDTSTAWSATVSSSDSSKTITGVDPA
jgi:hypothetical protein